MVPNKVLISAITGEYGRRAAFYDYYNLLHKPEGCMVLFCHDSSPAHGRNMLIDAAKINNCTHILFIDDDMAFPADSLDKLLEHDLDIVSGLYLHRQYPHAPLAMDLADDNGSCAPMYLLGVEPRLVPIVAAGFGFLLVKMSVFDKLEKPYVRLGELQADQWCDDIGFFNRVRKAGIQSYVDMDVRIGHMGSFTVWPQKDDKGNWVTGYDTNGATMLHIPQVSK